MPFMQHPAVGQIVIAETLMSQYFSVIEQACEAFEATGADEVSVFVAEANRVYPGIWEHLDQARSLLNDHGDLSLYDELRTEQGASVHQGGGARFSKPKSKLTLTGTKIVQKMKFDANVEGVMAAAEAAESLKELMPDVDWDQAHASAEADFVDFGAEKGRKLMIRAAVAVVAVIVVIVALSL
jgi:hypothetical protein